MDPLIDRARQGDAEALQELLQSVAPSVYRFGMRMCKSAPDAEDVLQDTLLAIAQHLGDFEGRSSLSSWVFALTRSACARRRRGLKNQPMAHDDEAPEPQDEAPSPEEGAARRELELELARALDGLSDEHREVIVLRDVEGLTAPEAAEALGISVDALKSRLHRARESLRRALAPILDQDAPPLTPACPDVMALLSRKLEGDLSAADCASMEDHLASCPACDIRCEALKRALAMCRRASSESVSPVVQARVKAALKVWAARPSNVGS